jgi:hypothetical protein
MTSQETLNIKVAVNELSFLLLTHTVYSDAWVDSYGVFKTGQGADHFLGRLDIQSNDPVWDRTKHKSCWGLNTDSVGHLLMFSTPTHTHVFDTHSHGYDHFSTATCGVRWVAGNWVNKGVEASIRL